MSLPYQPIALSTSVCGSHAHPAWLDLAVAATERGELGPADIREVQDDAVDLALRDQEEAGIDVVTDGEMRRVGFFTAEFYRHLSGVARWGRGGGWDRAAMTSSIASRSWSPSPRPRPGRGGGVRVRAYPDDAAAQGHAAGSLHAVWSPDLRPR